MGKWGEEWSREREHPVQVPWGRHLSGKVRGQCGRDDGNKGKNSRGGGADQVPGDPELPGENEEPPHTQAQVSASIYHPSRGSPLPAK